MKTNNIFDIIFVVEIKGKIAIFFFAMMHYVDIEGTKIFKTDDAWYRYWRESRQKSRDSATRIYEGFVMATVLLGPFQQKITKAQNPSWSDHYLCLCGVWSFFGICLCIDPPTRYGLSSMPLSCLVLSSLCLCCVFFVFDYFFVILLICFSFY